MNSLSPDGHDGTRRSADDPFRHAAEDQLRETRAPVRAHHHEIRTLGPGEADDLLVRHALEQEPLRADPCRLRPRQQLVELLLRPRSGRRREVVVHLGWDVRVAGHGHDRVEDVDDQQLGAARLRHLDRLAEGPGRGRGEIRGVENATNHRIASRGQYRWQETWWPEATALRAGATREHCSMANGQRGWKWQIGRASCREGGERAGEVEVGDVEG